LKNYSLYLFKDQKLVGAKNFEADDPMSARLIAARLLDASARECDVFELWQDGQRIDRRAPTTMVAARAARQNRIIDHEIALANSAWAFDRARELMKEPHARKPEAKVAREMLHRT
jgi:hypothetical protein